MARFDCFQYGYDFGLCLCRILLCLSSVTVDVREVGTDNISVRVEIELLDLSVFSRDCGCIDFTSE